MLASTDHRDQDSRAREHDLARAPEHEGPGSTGPGTTPRAWDPIVNKTTNDEKIDVMSIN